MDIFGRKKIAKLEAALIEAEKIGQARLKILDGVDDYLASLDDVKRREYVHRVAGIFPDTLKPQLESMIQLQKNTLARFGLSERESDILRANINGLLLLMEWGERCVNEQLGNVEEIRRKQQADENIISNLKDRYQK